MENTIKDILLQSKTDLHQKINEKVNIIQSVASEKILKLLVVEDDLFNNFTVDVSEDTINFRLTQDSWYDFRINRNRRYTVNTVEFDSLRICSSSIDTKDPNGFIKSICIGILSRHALYSTDLWSNLKDIMDEYYHSYTTQISPLYTSVHQIDRELNTIKNNNRQKYITDVFNKGTIKFEKNKTFTFGSKRHDYVSSSEFWWIKNGSGKTYTMSWLGQTRINDYYDGNGNYIDPEYADKVYTLDKRIKEKDLLTFINYNTQYENI